MRNVLPATRKSDHSITLHRDGTVSYWHVYNSRWYRRPAGSVPNRVLGTLTLDEERRIQSHTTRATVEA
jgi:hypothetical protein